MIFHSCYKMVLHSDILFDQIISIPHCVFCFDFKFARNAYFSLNCKLIYWVLDSHAVQVEFFNPFGEWISNFAINFLIRFL